MTTKSNSTGEQETGECNDYDLAYTIVEQMGLGTKEQCDELHLRKIDLADEVLVLNVEGYIGESTRNEINYAMRQGKPVRYLGDSSG